MNSEPLISVAVPAYNHGRFIRECRTSVRNQTYENLELVVIDDGSPDDTAQEVERFLRDHEARFSRVSFDSAPTGRQRNFERAYPSLPGWVHSSDRMISSAENKVAVQWRMFREWGIRKLALIYGDADAIRCRRPDHRAASRDPASARS